MEISYPPGKFLSLYQQDNVCPSAVSSIFHGSILFSNNLSIFFASPNICKHFDNPQINVGSYHTFTPFYSPSTPFQAQFVFFLQFLTPILSITLIFCTFCISSTLYSPSAQQMFLLPMVVQFIPHYTSKKDTLKADMLLVYNLKQHFQFLCL